MNQRSSILYDLLFATLLVVLTFVAFISYKRTNDFSSKADLVNHTQIVTLKLNEVLRDMLNAETGQRGYIISGDTSYLNPYIGSKEKVLQNLGSIDSLTATNAAQQERLRKLTTLVQLRFNLLLDNIQDFKEHGLQNAIIARFPIGRAYMDEIRKELSMMISEENNLLATRVKDKDHSAFIAPLYSLLLSILALTVVFIAYYKLRTEIFLRRGAEESEASLRHLQTITQESEIHFRHLVDNVPVLMWLSGADKSYVFFNKGWLQFTGRTLAQELGNGWEEAVHPDDIENCKSSYDLFFQARTEFSMEYRLRRHDGKYRWISGRAVPRFATDGTFLGFAGGCMDIQPQKNFAQELEEKVNERTIELKELNQFLLIKNNIFALAEENALLVSYSWNLKTGELECSDNVFSLLGYRPQEFVPSLEKFQSMIHPDDREQVIKDGQETLVTRKLVEHVYRIYTKQGEVRYFRSSGNFIGDEQEQYLVGSMQDVTKDTLLTASLQQKNLELLHNNEELKSFSYIASHDLQEPLRKIQSFNKLILEKEKDNLSATAKDYFERTISAAARMQNLIDALLNYSAAANKKMSFVLTDLNKIVEEIKENMSDVIADKKAVIECDVLPILNVIPLQIQQLFSNLISNALKYSQTGVPPHITIRATQVPPGKADIDLPDKKRNYWKLVFSDNGIGFEQQYETKIFELFQRLHARTEFEGTGIGLAICKKIVFNHKGYISAVGEKDKGAVFTIYLPANN